MNKTLSSITMCTVEDLTKTGIYCITQKSTGRKYIGSASKSFYKRWERHIYDLNKLCHHSLFLQRAWDKYGCSDFTFEILEIWKADISTNNKQLLELEQIYLDNFKPEFNMSPSAHNRKGMKATKEAREKMSLASKNRIRKPFSEETKEKMSNAKTIRSTNTYVLTSPEGLKTVTKNLKEFCRKNNLNYKNLFSVIGGARKHSQGWKASKISSEQSELDQALKTVLGLD